MFGPMVSKDQALNYSTAGSFVITTVGGELIQRLQKKTMVISQWFYELLATVQAEKKTMLHGPQVC